ncbi:MAG: sigma-70 family RNA polymerase sigma factor, partial [Phycisphaerales bacterium]|nr:sigma-70 family RNA polymerase sigma factor [Phycisphaerales bacterium]MBT7170994.1 sigma-70 family RNA polymerase sigma factor [Phycisphaerales bacterium]
ALRSRARRQAASLDAPFDDAPKGRSLKDLLVAKNSAPDQFSMNRETRHAVLQQISEMDSRLREVLSLSYLTELTHTEIAEILEIPLGTVKSRLHQALRDFAERWRRSKQDTDQ